MRHRVSPPQKHSHYCEKGHKLKTGVARRKFPNTNGPGDRQKGPVQAESVINCAPNRVDIGTAIQRLYDGEFMEKVAEAPNPYGNGGASIRTVDELKNRSFKKDLKTVIPNQFYDIPQPH